MVTIVGLQRPIEAEVVKRVNVIAHQVELCRTGDNAYTVCLCHKGIHKIVPCGNDIFGGYEDKLQMFESVVRAHQELKEIEELNTRQFDWFHVPDSVRKQVSGIFKAEGYRVLLIRHTSNHPADGYMFTILGAGIDKKPNNYIVVNYNATLHRLIDNKSGLTYPEAEKTMSAMIKDITIRQVH